MLLGSYRLDGMQDGLSRRQSTGFLGALRSFMGVCLTTGLLLTLFVVGAAALLKVSVTSTTSSSSATSGISSAAGIPSATTGGTAFAPKEYAKVRGPMNMTTMSCRELTCATCFCNSSSHGRAECASGRAVHWLFFRHLSFKVTSSCHAAAYSGILWTSVTYMTAAGCSSART